MESYRIPEPPQFVYDTPKGYPSPRQVFKEGEKNGLFTIKKIDYPETGGIFIYYEGLLFPRKGFPYPEAVWAVNLIKRAIMSTVRFLSRKEFILAILALIWTLIIPRAEKKKKRLIRKLIEPVEDYLDVMDAFLYMPRADNGGKSFYLQTKYFMLPAIELARYAMLFLKYLGIEREAFLQKVGRVVCMIIEYDTAYCWRIQDIFSEINKESLLSNPRKEIGRLIKIFCQREKTSDKVVKSFRLISYILRVALCFKRIKTSFLKATEDIDFSKIAFTEADKYHMLFLEGYDFMGKSVEERQQILMDMHGGEAPRAQHRLKVND